MAELKQPGDWIADRFQVFEVYQGGMGVVYVVNDHHGTTGRQLVALKTLKDEILVHRVQRTRFATECRLWVQLGEHPNIVQAYSVEILAGRPYVVLELVRGGDLNRWIRSPNLDLIQALKFGVQFCFGLEHGLRQGLSSHRDIKPANLLITSDAVLKLTDFGLADVSEEMVAVRASSSSDDGSIPLAETPIHQTIRWSDPRDQPRPLDPSPPTQPVEEEEGPDGSIEIELTPFHERQGKSKGPSGRPSKDKGRIGTAVYMAPEQFRDPSSVDVRADIYSFGVVFFEMIAGHPPFRADSIDKLNQLHSLSAPPSIARFIPPKFKKIAPEIEAIVRKCLAKNPSDRFAKVSELRKAILRVLNEVGVRM